MDKISAFLELPDTCVPVTTIVVGYPDENPSKRDRLPISSFLHEEVYKTPSVDDIEEIYLQREVKGWERYMSHPEIKKRIEELGILNLAHSYTNPVKYDRCPRLQQVFLDEKGIPVVVLDKQHLHLAGNGRRGRDPGLRGVPSHRPALFMAFVCVPSLTGKVCG